MIPLHLHLSGFLSYREPVDLDFTSFDLACISGENGAGKSSLLDAITWAIFGQARKRDDSVINAQSNHAEACLTFAYEGNIYRIQRSKPRDKTAMLEFHILQNDGNGNGSQSLATPISLPSPSAQWKPLTEHTLRETEARIQQTLRLDYETFINAAFFLQGKADQFTQQRPGDRKRILGSILGLEVWELYRQRAAERRREMETEISGLEGRLNEIAAELAEEDQRKDRLEQLETDLKRLSQERATQEAALENIRKITATLEEQGRLVEALARQLEASSHRLRELELRAAARSQERGAYAEILSRSEAIHAEYASWQALRTDLERWEEVAARFREHEKRREGPRDEINAARARLAQELHGLQVQEKQVESLLPEIDSLKSKIEIAHQALAQAEGQLSRRAQLDVELQAARQRQAEARAENPRLKSEMDELQERIDQLTQAEGANCPLCGQPLSAQERQELILSLKTRGKEMGDRYRANKALLSQSDGQVRDLERQIAGLSGAEVEMRRQAQAAAQLSSRLEILESQQEAWQSSGALRLQEVKRDLEEETFAPEAHANLAEIDAGLKAIGYDAAAHEAVRRAEQAGRAAEAELRALEKAQAALAPLEREINDLEAQAATLSAEVGRQQDEYRQAVEALAAARAQAPDLFAAESLLLSLQEQENRVRLEVGAARQKVLVLDDLKARRKTLAARREQLARKTSEYRQLERAFGKDGVPALLIEQALPQIESKSNEILDRLTGGSMSVRFVTQSAYKDKRRDDLRETLEIQISDGAGTRDYEMFSIDGSEPVYIRNNGRIFCRTIQDLWQTEAATRIDGEYEFQEADFEALCYEDGKAVWLPAENILRHPAPKEMLRITFAPGGYSVKITANHSIFVMTPDGLKVKRGDEIKPGDYVLTPRGIPGGQIQEKVDLLDWISPEVIARRESFKKKLCWDEQKIWSRIDQPINRYALNNDVLAEFMGLAVAEGSGRKAYTISAGSDAEMAGKVVKLANDIFGTSRRSVTLVSAERMAKYVEKNPGISIQYPKEQYRPFVGGRLVADILKNMVGCGSNQKHIPASIFNATEEVKTSFLKGLISGDGHTRVRKEKGQVEIGITTVSPKLVADTIFLCRQLGIWATVEKHGNAGFHRGMEHQLSYRISINGGANTKAFLDTSYLKYSTLSAYDGIPLNLVGISRHTRQKRIKRVLWDEHYPCGARVVPLHSQGAYQKMARWLEDWAVLEVSSVEKSSPSTPYVYDLVVPENHSFVAGTGLILVHNSGGEAFRVNFAIRLALSEVLAQRAGARLQTLVIDEGFGSQDTQGRQRLIEAINLIRQDFAKILVITHIDELKDIFPNRIEVEKTERGSTVRVV